jgi:hypothetical protein
MSFDPSRSLLFLRHGAALAGLMMILGASPAAAVPTFTQSCFANNLSHAIAVADFNNDGKLDIAITPGQQAGSTGFTIQPLVDIYLGDGAGTFTFATQLNTAAAFLDMFATDVDNDGNQDIVTGGDPTSVLRGNGNGTFQAAQTYPDGELVVAVGDLNGDGFPDLISPEQYKKNIAVRLNQGNGTFGAETEYRIGDFARELTTSDFNGDGNVDVVTLNQSSNNNGVTVLLGKGDGKFGHPINTNLPGFPGRDLGPADLNGDGKMDLVVPLYLGGGLLVVLGNGNGSFGPPTSYAMAGNTTRVAVGDVNGDGNADIVAGNFTAATVSVLYGDGSGAFTIGSVISVAFGNGVEVGNFNADSNLDIVVDSCVLLNNGGVAAAKATPALGKPVATAEAPKVLTADFSPNPLRDHGTLGFSLPKEGTVSIHLYDIRGRHVQTLLDGARFPAGSYSVGLDRRAAGLGAGIYFYRIEAEGSRKSGSIVILDR